MTISEQPTNDEAQRDTEQVGYTKPRALIFDFSWVLLHPKDRDYTGKLNDLNRKYTNDNPLGPYVNSSFEDQFELNQELLNEIKRIKQQYSLPVYMFTTDIIQERPEVQAILKPNPDNPKEDIFNRIFTAREMVDKAVVKTPDLDKAKTQSEAFKYIAEEIQLPTEAKLYIDDKPQNLDAAQSAAVGFEVYEYTKQSRMKESNEILFNHLRQIFPVQNTPDTLS